VAFVGAFACGYGYYTLFIEDITFLDEDELPEAVSFILILASVGGAAFSGIVSWLMDAIAGKQDQPKSGEKSLDQIKEELSRKIKESQRVSDQLEDSKNRVLSLSSLMVSLSNMAKVVGATLDPGKVVETTMENVIRNMNATKVSLVFINPETQEMELASHHGWGAAEVQAFSEKMGEGLVGYVAKNNVVVDEESIKSDPNLSQITKFSGKKTYICAPLSTKDSVVGVLNIEAVEKKKSENKSEQMRLVTILTSLAAMAIQNAQLFKKTQEWATIDALTGLNNRRSMLDFFEKEVERADKEGFSIAFFMSDIDHFKGFNDTYGHAIGDFVLSGVAKEYTKVSRDGDLAGRYGGEEFGQILPKTDKTNARAIAEQLRKNIETRQFDTEAGKLSVTLSLGVASYPEDGKTMAEVMQSADEMLYVCKESGRNMVCVRGVDEINEKVALKIALDKAKNKEPEKVPELEARLAALLAGEHGDGEAPQEAAQAPPPPPAQTVAPARPPRPPGPRPAKPPGPRTGKPPSAPPGAMRPPGPRPSAGAKPPGARPAGPRPPGPRPPAPPRPPGARPGVPAPGARPPAMKRPPGARPPRPVVPKPGAPRPPTSPRVPRPVGSGPAKQ